MRGTPRQALFIDPDGALIENAARVISARIDELLGLERHLRDHLRVTELHEMRIAAKRLRYTLELFVKNLPRECAEAVGPVASIQELLGAIHDADVLVPRMVAHLRTELRSAASGHDDIGVYAFDPAATDGILLLCKRKRRERHSLYLRFLREWRALRRQRFFERLRERLAEAARVENEELAAGAHTEMLVDPAAVLTPNGSESTEDE